MAKNIDFPALCAGLNAVQKGKEFVALCPAHNDTHPSLYLSESARDGKPLLKCMAGCSQEAVLGALRARGLWPEKKFQGRPSGVPKEWSGAAYTSHWHYRCPDTQKVLGLVVRFDAPDGTKSVIPFFRRFPNGRWRAGHALEQDRPLYNAQHIAKATTVFVVEGEKCADAITNSTKTVVGVTWPGGANSVMRANWTLLDKHQDVRIWPDNDAPGIAAAHRIQRRLPHARSVDLAQFGTIPEGWDCADWTGDPDPRKLILSPLPASTEELELEQSEPSKELSLTDAGNADRFVNMWRGRARYVPNLGWYFWQNNTWQKDDSGQIILACIEVARGILKEAQAELDPDSAKEVHKFANSSQFASRLEAMAKLAAPRPEIVAQPDDLDADPFLFCCANGVVDLTTGKISPNKPELLITKQSPVVFDPEATAPIWTKFLRRIMGENEDLILYLQRAIGYSLTSDTSEQVMFMLWGGGQNGKSVFIETLAKIFGTYHAATTSDLVLLDTQAGENAVARLKGARFVPASEVPENSRFNEARIKQLTGQDTIAARFLYREYFEFKPHFKFWLRCNSRPQIQGSDLGIWRRMHCVPFTQTITEAEKDKHLGAKLLQELPGILNWCIAGCQQWLQMGLAAPHEVADAISEYREDMDRLGQWLEECCIQDSELRVKSRTLYESYKAWCEDAGERPLSQRMLMIKIKDRGFKRMITAGSRYYLGLDIKSAIN